MEHNMFNIQKLHINEQELLILLMEECAEVIHVASKCIRDKDYKPTQTDEGAANNIQWLCEEVIGLELIIKHVKNTYYTSIDKTEVIKKRKTKKLIKYTNVFKKIDV